MGKKRFLWLAIVCSMLLLTGSLLAGCENEEEIPQYFNQLGYHQFTDAEQKLLGNIESLNDQKYYCYDYQIQDAITSWEVWVETYIYGVLQEDLPFGLHQVMDEPWAIAGSIIIAVGNGISGSPWGIVSLNEEGSVNSSLAPQALLQAPVDYSAYIVYDSNGLAQPSYEVILSEEMVLYWGVYCDDATDTSALEGIEMPDLTNYPLAHVVKIRFSGQ